MKESEVTLLVGVVAIALVVYFGRPRKLSADNAGEGSDFPGTVYVPGGGDFGGNGATGSWLMMRPPLI